MRALLPVHQVRARDARAQRQAGSDAFRDANDIGLHFVVLASEHFAGAAHAALNFVKDKKDSVFVANPTQAFQKALWRGDVAAFTLNRLDDNRGNFFRRRSRLEQTVFYPIERALRRTAAAAVFSTERVAIVVWIRHMHYVERLPFET